MKLHILRQEEQATQTAIITMIPNQPTQLCRRMSPACPSSKFFQVTRLVARDMYSVYSDLCQSQPMLRLILLFIIQIFLFMISSFIYCPKVLPSPSLELSSGNAPISKGFVFHFHKALLLYLPWGGVADAQRNMNTVKEVETLMGPQLCTIRLCSWLSPPQWSQAANILPSLPPHLDNSCWPIEFPCLNSTIFDN